MYTYIQIYTYMHRDRYMSCECVWGCFDTSNHQLDSSISNASHCNTLQQSATLCTLCNTLQHSATLCNTLQHSATLCNTLQQAASRLQQAASRLHNIRLNWLEFNQKICSSSFFSEARCNILRQAATGCNRVHEREASSELEANPCAAHGDTPHHTATHCNALKQAASQRQIHVQHTENTAPQ